MLSTEIVIIGTSVQAKHDLLSSSRDTSSAKMLCYGPVSVTRFAQNQRDSTFLRKAFLIIDEGWGVLRIIYPGSV